MLSWVSLLDSVTAFADLPSRQSLVTTYVPLAVLTVLLAASLLKAVRVWEEIHDVEEPDTPRDLLASFEEAHAAGELDDDEFARVREQLGGASCPDEAGKSRSSGCDESTSSRIVSLEGNHGQFRSHPKD